MKVVLINPPSINGILYIREGRCEQQLSSFQYSMPPISLPSIAGLLKKNGFDVYIFDLMVESISYSELIKRLNEIKPSLIIMNISTVTYNSDMKFVNKLKENANAYIASIGIHTTVHDESSLMNSKLDFVIRNEPERSAVELAKCIRDNSNISEVKGLSYKENDNYRKNQNRPFIEDLDELPLPDRSLINNEKYTLPIINKSYTLLIPARGCPYDCIFCTASIYYGKKPRYRSVNNVLEEIEEIVGKYKLNYITMWSDTFTLNKNFVIEISKEIIKNKLKFNWMCNSRVDTIDEEMLYWMKNSGCVGISYGVESGDQTILDNIKKKITVEQIKKAIKLTNKMGIQSLAHIIFGLPGETKKTINNTIKLVKEIKPTFVQYYCAVPFPGTEFYEMAVKNSWIITKDWSKFEINNAIISTDLLSASELSMRRIYAYLKTYTSFYYIKSRLNDIKSAKDLFTFLRQTINFFKSWIFQL